MKTLAPGPAAPPRLRRHRKRWPAERAVSAAEGAVSVVVVGWLFCAGLICGSVLPASATSAKSTDRVTFGIAPASARGPNGRSYLSYGVTPGAFLSDHVAVLNYSTVPLTLQVYVTNATETLSGGFGLAPAGQTLTGLESWVSVPSRLSTVSVPASSSSGPGEVVIPLTVRIPDNATPGDRVGGVVASLRTVGTNAKGERVILLQRVGTRLFIRVNGKLAPRLTIADLETGYQGTLNPFGQGQVKVSYLVRNTGNVDLALGHQAISVSGLLGITRHAGLGGVGLLIPGASIDESLVVHGVWPQFLLHTTVSAQPVVVAAGNALGSVSGAASTSLWAVPWSPLCLVAVIVLSFVLAYRLRARRTARPRAHRPQVVGA